MKNTRISFLEVDILIYGIVLGSIVFSRFIVGGNGIYVKYISNLLILITMCLQILALDLYAHYDLKKNNIFTTDDKLHYSNMKSNVREGEIRNIKVEKKYKNKARRCYLQLGYTKERLEAWITKIEVVNGKDTDLHIDKPVYAIHLTNIKGHEK